jgi:glycosyltransferase involved in cell wall biosynthesis
LTGVTDHIRPIAPAEPDVALLTGGWDPPYAFGLSTALFAKGVRLDLICGEELNVGGLDREPRVAVLRFLKDDQPAAGVWAKIARIALYYARLVRYAWAARPKIFHILWNNKFQTFDRVFLMLYYRLLGKRLVLTAHNVNAGTRDATDTFLNRLTLRIQYSLSDHIFVHTEKMKAELVENFGVRGENVTVVHFGINNAVPQTGLTTADARRRLGIAPCEKTMLFFGNIAPYKGLEYLLEAYRQMASAAGGYRLIIAGRLKKGCDEYWTTIEGLMGREPEKDGIIPKIEYIPDEETEVYFKAADVLVLPYVSIFQSGVLFLGYSFGLPVLAADVGSLKDDIVEGKTGAVFAPQDAGDLAKGLEAYFASELFADLEAHRSSIRNYANARYSWCAVADATLRVYTTLLQSP